MNKPVVITAYGIVNSSGFGGSALAGGRRSWSACDSDGLPWNEMPSMPSERFGRMDILTKYAIAAVEMLALPTMGKGEQRPDTAIVMSTKTGCLSIDLDFYASIDQPGGGSPLLFMYTLYSSALGEIAIRHQITGPNLCLAAGIGDDLLSLWEGWRLLQCGEAKSCICLECNAASPRAAALFDGGETATPKAWGWSHAFLLETKESSGALGFGTLARVRPAHVQAETLDPIRKQESLYERPAYICDFLAATNKDACETIRLPPPSSLGGGVYLRLMREVV